MCGSPTQWRSTPDPNEGSGAKALLPSPPAPNIHSFVGAEGVEGRLSPPPFRFD